jgi:hypothetical protein
MESLYKNSLLNSTLAPPASLRGAFLTLGAKLPNYAFWDSTVEVNSPPTDYAEPA